MPARVAGGFLWTAARHLQSGLQRQPLDALGKTQAVGLHNEIDGAAVGAATEAMKESFVVGDRERGRLFVVERAQADEFAPAAGQFHLPSDQAGELDAGTQLFQKMR